jgi:hypothetical protein
MVISYLTDNERKFNLDELDFIKNRCAEMFDKNEVCVYVNVGGHTVNLVRESGEGKVIKCYKMAMTFDMSEKMVNRFNDRKKVK